MRRVKVFEAYVVGLVRGALANLGMEPSARVKLTMVKSETIAYPSLELKIVMGGGSRVAEQR